jgi:hypothetical protein
MGRTTKSSVLRTIVRIRKGGGYTLPIGNVPKTSCEKVVAELPYPDNCRLA